MDFIRRHLEKILLALALLSLIATAVVLAFKVDTLSTDILGAARRVPKKGEPLLPIDLGPYTNAIMVLNKAPTWEKPNQPLFVPVIQTIAEAPPTNVITDVPIPEFPVKVSNIQQEPFKLLFKSYSFNEKTSEGYNFQINFRDFRKTFFIRAVGAYIMDPWENSGYNISSFERKFEKVNDRKTGGMRDEDVSRITIQHEGEDPLVLVLGKVTVQKEPVAWVSCGGGAPSPKRRGQQFNCEDKTWIVVDITSTQVIIIDAQTQERRLIPVR